MSVPDADGENASILVEAVNYEVSFKGMYPDRRRNLMAFARHSWVRGDEFESRKKLIMISFGNQCSEDTATAYVGSRGRCSK